MAGGDGALALARASVAAGRAPAAPQAARDLSAAEVARARKVAQDFEAFFLSQALQPMFAELTPEQPFGGGNAEQMWRSLQVEEYGKAIARQGGIGLADSIMREMLKVQEAPVHGQ
ncbi:MAG: rod-binding protein [Hyphomicrobiales bacterium]|nr:rod-binding protein [Hyphomicrobiales bacterium]MCP5373628.1 rod-binding protein [Hyphomicrobiales bacterium]